MPLSPPCRPPTLHPCSYAGLLSAGGDRDPDALQALFSSLGSIFKAAAKQLLPRLPEVLKHTAAIRYSATDHVRALAAETLGFLFRQAADKQLKAGVRSLLAEHAARPAPERTHGAGLLLAEAVLGPSHGLHSRAPAVLRLALAEDLLRPSDFGSRQQQRDQGQQQEQGQEQGQEQEKGRQEQGQQQEAEGGGKKRKPPASEWRRPGVTDTGGCGRRV
jgi:hypothetical protein